MVKEDKWHIKGFIDFQYGELKDTINAHISVIKILTKYGLYKGHTSPSQAPKDKEKDNQDGDKGLVSYGAVVIRRSLQSKNSPYYYKYKKYYTKIDNLSSVTTYEIQETGELSNDRNLYNIPNETPNYQYKKLELIDIELDKLYWYDRELFKLYYYEDNTLDSLADKTGIGRNSLFNTIDNVRNILKEKLGE